MNKKLPKPSRNRGCFWGLHAWGGWEKHGNSKVRTCTNCRKQQKRGR